MLNGLNKSRAVAIFISGGGSTLQALLELQHHINIGLVVTNKKNILGISKAKRFGKKLININNKTDYLEVNRLLIDHKIEYILLAGFMKILPPNFIALWKNKIINIHPSLLPMYPGLSAAEKSWTDNAAMGATLHIVTDKMDAGDIKLQQKSLSNSKYIEYIEANLFLRRTEQFLLRELTIRYF